MKHNRNRGFTLIELLVGLAILSVLALLAVTAFDGARSKAQALIGLMKQVGDANIMLKNDTGCYVKRPDALFNKEAAATAGYNFCGRSFGKTWYGPYLGLQEVNASNGNIRAEKIGAGVEIVVRAVDPQDACVHFVHDHRAAIGEDAVRRA